MPFHVNLDEVDASAADLVVQSHRRDGDLLDTDAALSVKAVGEA